MAWKVEDHQHHKSQSKIPKGVGIMREKVRELENGCRIPTTGIPDILKEEKGTHEAEEIILNRRKFS